jgi:hypothetical protein
MNDFLVWFVHHPLRLVLLAVPFALAWLMFRQGGGSRAGRSRVLLYPAGFFLVFAGWEWLVMSRTPEADIRVDLLVIWSVAAILVIWAVARMLRR